MVHVHTLDYLVNLCCSIIAFSSKGSFIVFQDHPEFDASNIAFVLHINFFEDLALLLSISII